MSSIIKYGILALTGFGLVALTTQTELGSIFHGTPQAATPQQEASLKLETFSGTTRIAGPGRIEPDQGEIDVGTEINGVIEKLNVREGDAITEGQILGNVRNADLLAKVKEARALLEMKKQNLLRLKAGSLPEQVNKAAANLLDVKAQLALAQTQLQRQKEFRSAGYSTPATIDTANATVAELSARMRSAEADLAILRKGSRSEEIGEAVAEVENASAQVELAESNVKKSLIISPLTGTVLRRYRDPGSAVSGNGSTPIFQVANTNNLIVRMQVDETDIALAQTDRPAEITIPAFPGKKLSGHVVRVSPRLGAKTITADLPTEKRDARVLDVIIKLDGNPKLPIGLRVDSFIN